MLNLRSRTGRGDGSGEATLTGDGGANGVDDGEATNTGNEGGVATGGDEDDGISSCAGVNRRTGSSEFDGAS